MHDDKIRQALHDIGADIPPTLDLWPSIRARAIPPSHPAPRWRSYPVAFGVVAAMVLLAILIWTSRPHAVSAAEIVTNAQLAAQDPAAVGVTSYVVTQRSVMTSLERWMSPGEAVTQADKQTVVVDTSSWYRAPNHMRTEQQLVSLVRGENVFAGTPLPSYSGTYVNDGEHTWLYYPERNEVWMDVQWPEWARPSGAQLALWPTFLQMKQLPEIEDALSDCFTPTTEGSGEIAGRPVWVIDLGQPTGCLPAIYFEIDLAIPPGVRLWVDKETFFILKTQRYQMQRDGTGEFIEAADPWAPLVEVTHIEYNVPIADERFTFTPPPGATIVPGSEIEFTGSK